MIKKKIATVLALLLVIVLGVGCAGNQPSQTPGTQTPGTQTPGSSNKPSSGEKRVLKVLTYDDDYFAEIIADFESKYPEITVERKSGQGVDTGAMNTMLASDDTPDVLLMNSGPGRVLPLAKAGMLEDLSAYYVDRGWDKSVSPLILDILKKQDEKIYEVCNGVDIFQIYYNKAEFAELGLKEPKTWDEFVQLNEKIKQAGKLAISVGGRDNYMLGWLMGNLFQSSVGRDYMTDIIYGDASFNDPKMERAYQVLKDFVDKGYISKDVVALDGNEAHTAFVAGQSVMAISNQGDISIFANDGSLDPENVGVFSVPSMEGNPAVPTVGMAHSWTISAKAKNKDDALLFLDYVASMDYMKKRAELNFWKYGVAAVNLTEDLNIDPIVKNAIAAVEQGGGYNPSVFVSPGVKTAYYEGNQAVAAGMKTPKEALAAIQTANEEK